MIRYLLTTKGDEMNKKNKDTPSIDPFLKWAGGKRRLVPILRKKFPKRVKRFIEPFVGSGAVALNMDAPECIISDTNKDLILVFTELKKLGSGFIDECRKLFVSKNNTRDAYDSLKNEFNTIGSRTTDDKLRKATLFIYLNRHCFNGLCRYNGSGEFNVPFGKYEKPYFPAAEFTTAIERVQKIEIKVADFRDIFDTVCKDDAVYCDPPYLPKSESANFDDYSVGGFSLRDHIELAACAAKAAKRGATVVISNHYNWYSREIYKKMYGGSITTLDVSRTISCKSEERDPVKELIAVFKPETES